ncbi:hypothetical protein DEU56DRAFT_497397 [Suillus clintonianus]|uniref:uncharacterized protein n=1 Tax=Suillus clintonianus TaxID=1904413 RepID=UPI001B87FDDA|nr:uncharacterized protein DEU56DRAFT_497397 [Suillus clintonianus]KAG2129094.1 hypothetical protein DEU56DRAFT_497397 [Suillus clintonianus]
MVYYCGYLVRDDWLLQRAVELGRPPPVNTSDEIDVVSVSTGDVRIETGVYCYTKVRQVKTAKGTAFWCIAFASNDPGERLPTSAPSEEKYKALKEVLQKKGPPRWYRAY